MRTNQTTFMRAIAQARKLEPETKQINNSFFFDVASTSILDAWHHVTLGPKPLNVFTDSKCDCGGTNHYKLCLHVASAFLLYTANLEARLEKGYNYLHSGQVLGKDYDEAFELWQDLLNRYEKNCDLIRAIEQGFDISQLVEPFKHRLATSFDNILLSA